MKLPRSLSAKIFLTAFLNLALLLVVSVIFARIQYRFDLSSFLLAPARDKILSTSRLLALQLPDTPRGSWNELLRQYASRYRTQLYLFDESGAQFAGPGLSLPQSVFRAMQHHPFGPVKRSSEMPDSARSSRPLGEGPLFLVETGNPAEYWVGADIPIWSDGQRRPAHGFLLWRLESLWTNPFLFNYEAWATVILAIIGVSVICWLPLIRDLTVTISEVTRATGRIAEGHFEISLPAKRQDELGRLSVSINRMAARLSGFVHGQRRFLSDVAHELCSPVARMQVALGILDQRVQGAQRSYVAGLQDEVQHISSLINELLLFSKAQIGTSSVELARVNVADTVRRVIDREAHNGAVIETLVDEEIEVLASGDYLFRSLANVVRNAVRYAGSAGPIVISADNGGNEVIITVADAGPGLPEAELEHVFKPFYRPEFARQRETGGVGLGLAIVRSCIEACDGSVQCRNRDPHGLEVELRLQAPKPHRNNGRQTVA